MTIIEFLMSLILETLLLSDENYSHSLIMGKILSWALVDNQDMYEILISSKYNLS